MISMIFMAGGIKTTLAQGNPMIPSATDQGTNSSNATVINVRYEYVRSTSEGGGSSKCGANKTTVARDLCRSTFRRKKPFQERDHTP